VTTRRPVGQEVEAVDDAAQRDVADGRFELELEPDRLDRARVFHGHVVGGDLAALGEEPARLLATELEVREVGVHLVLGDRLVDAAVEPGRRALGGGMEEQQLERTVNERPLGGGRRGRIGQLLDAGEPERERAGQERLDARRRQARGHRPGRLGDRSHGTHARATVREGCDI
jgi:hypothetical protein